MKVPSMKPIAIKLYLIVNCVYLVIKSLFNGTDWWLCMFYTLSSMFCCLPASHFPKEHQLCFDLWRMNINLQRVQTWFQKSNSSQSTFNCLHISSSPLFLCSSCFLMLVPLGVCEVFGGWSNSSDAFKGQCENDLGQSWHSINSFMHHLIFCCFGARFTF